ncbi:unnamed protein product [Peniophora sp. CBMAI 1063]|nr:unnamed protein product [Peniophora sp. CBMAI 1063]
MARREGRHHGSGSSHEGIVSAAMSVYVYPYLTIHLYRGRKGVPTGDMIPNLSDRSVLDPAGLALTSATNLRPALRAKR